MSDQKSPLWSRSWTIDELAKMGPGTLGATIGLTFTAIEDQSLQARIPVDERTKQPAGLLHGGATAALAETLGSVASYMIIDPEKEACVGIELNASHLRSMREGFATGTCYPHRIGKTMHVWGIDVRDEQQRLISVCRLTVAIIARSKS